MDLLTKGRTQMTLTPGGFSVATPANTVPGPEQGEKLDAYARAGVTEYWIAEPTSRTIEILTKEADTYHSHGIFEGKTTLTSKVIPDFPIQVKQLFAYVQR
jgi:Uma2 family endonuclease